MSLNHWSNYVYEIEGGDGDDNIVNNYARIKGSVIGGWLHDNGFESVQQILDSNNETNINNIIAQFQTAD